MWGKENEMAKIEESILAISVFLPRFNATSRHYYYRIRIFLRHLSLEIQSLLFIFVDFIGSIIFRVDGNFPQPYFSVYKKANIHYIKSA